MVQTTRSFSNLHSADSNLEISKSCAIPVKFVEQSIDSVVTPVDVAELVVSVRSAVVSIAQVAAVGTVWLSWLACWLVISVLLVGGLGSIGLLRGLVWLVGGLGSIGVLRGLVSLLSGLLVSVARALRSGVAAVLVVSVARALRSGVAAVLGVFVRLLGSGVVAKLGVGVIRMSTLGSNSLFSGVASGVGGVGPWVLMVLTVEVEMRRVGSGTSGDGAGVSVSVTSLWVVLSDLLLSVTTPEVVGLRFVVWVRLVVELLGRVELGGVAGGLSVGVSVLLHTGVDSLGLGVMLGLVRAVVTTLGGHGGGGKCKNKSGFHVCNSEL